MIYVCTFLLPLIFNPVHARYVPDTYEQDHNQSIQI